MCWWEPPRTAAEPTLYTPPTGSWSSWRGRRPPHRAPLVAVAALPALTPSGAAATQQGSPAALARRSTKYRWSPQQAPATLLGGIPPPPPPPPPARPYAVGQRGAPPLHEWRAQTHVARFPATWMADSGRRRNYAHAGPCGRALDSGRALYQQEARQTPPPLSVHSREDQAGGGPPAQKRGRRRRWAGAWSLPNKEGTHGAGPAPTALVPEAARARACRQPDRARGREPAQIPSCACLAVGCGFRGGVPRLGASVVSVGGLTIMGNDDGRRAFGQLSEEGKEKKAGERTQQGSEACMYVHRGTPARSPPRWTTWCPLRRAGSGGGGDWRRHRPCLTRAGDPPRRRGRRPPPPPIPPSNLPPFPIALDRESRQSRDPAQGVETNATIGHHSIILSFFLLEGMCLKLGRQRSGASAGTPQGRQGRA